MINLSESYRMIDNTNCFDVATSLFIQGITPDMDISIPIYDIFFLNVLTRDRVGFVANSMGELSALAELTRRCGAVIATINIGGIDTLSLIGALLVSTPNTGLNIFIKFNKIEVNEEVMSLLDVVTDSLGITIPEEAIDIAHDFLCDIIQQSFDSVTELLQDDMDMNGINICHWHELPSYFNEIKRSGEMLELYTMRSQLGAPTF